MQIFVLVGLFFFYPAVNGQAYVFFADLITWFVNLAGLQTDIFPRYPDLKKAGPADQYDFIIIGSSPSGSVLANRLTENPKVSVLLLENGEEAGDITDITLVSGVLDSTQYNYQYRTQLNPDLCKGCIKKTLIWQHGKALGGSSITNFMIYVRGNKRDYNRWAELGNSGWSFKDLFPYFIKMEDSHVAKSEPGYRGRGGYLTVSDVKRNTKIGDVYVRACQEAGYKYVDYNGKEQLGVSFIQATIRDGLRCSAEKAYLRPIRNRPNLKIKTKAKVTKILINSFKNIANGVEYYKDGSFYKVYANKEVILSAGALNSPQVLMLSGIGPKEQLEPLGIPVIKDLPVGKKMYDHAACPLVMFQINESITLNTIAEFTNPINYLKFALGKGFFTSLGIVEAITYVKVNVSTDPDPLYPDIELLMLAGHLGSGFGILLRSMFNIPPLVYDKMFKPLEDKYVYQVTPILLHPKSYGFIRLNSSSPFDPPLFYPNFFSDLKNLDIKVLIAGIRELQRINKAPALQRYNSTLVSIPVPGCDDKQFDSDSYWECAIRTITASYWHPVATCKMSPQKYPESVVDNKLRLHGIKNLRVVDTSIIPIPTSAHNVAPAYVIGEKAADIIKSYWNL